MSEQWSLEKLNQLITNQVQENLNFEYKSAGALDKTEKKEGYQVTGIIQNSSLLLRSSRGCVFVIWFAVTSTLEIFILCEDNNG
jgi:hypothetical protein